MAYNTSGRQLGSRNYERTRATRSDPVENHVRLTEAQFNEVTNDFMQWRWARAQVQRDNIIIDIGKDKVKMETFLEYTASGGFYRQVS